MPHPRGTPQLLQGHTFQRFQNPQTSSIISFHRCAAVFVISLHLQRHLNKHDRMKSSPHTTCRTLSLIDSPRVAFQFSYNQHSSAVDLPSDDRMTSSTHCSVSHACAAPALDLYRLTRTDGELRMEQNNQMADARNMPNAT